MIDFNLYKSKLHGAIHSDIYSQYTQNGRIKSLRDIAEDWCISYRKIRIFIADLIEDNLINATFTRKGLDIQHVVPTLTIVRDSRQKDLFLDFCDGSYTTANNLIDNNTLQDEEYESGSYQKRYGSQNGSSLSSNKHIINNNLKEKAIQNRSQNGSRIYNIVKEDKIVRDRDKGGMGEKEKEKERKEGKTKLQFKQFWNQYPRKQNYKGTYAQFKILVKGRDFDFESILGGLKGYLAYISEKGIQEQFILLPENFLKNERWRDTYKLNKGDENDIKKDAEFIRRARAIFGEDFRKKNKLAE